MSSIFIDSTFIPRIGLEGLVKKNSVTWQARCPICGDLKERKNKKRGYIFRRKNDLFFHCHNCNAHMSVANLIKKVNPTLYNEYQLEALSAIPFAPRKESVEDTYKKLQLAKKPVVVSKQIDLPSIQSLPEHHFAKQYVKGRRIPEKYFNKLYFANDFRAFLDVLKPDHGKELPYGESRLVIPFYDENSILQGVNARAIQQSQIRYITIKLNDEGLKYYGLDTLDKSKKIYVTEGPFDSMFLSNAIATMDSALYNACRVLGFDCDYTFVYDNQPRNNAVVKNMRNTIRMGQPIFIWPRGLEEFKDINEAVEGGTTPAVLQSIIDRNTFTGLRAELELTTWEKI